MTEQEIRDQARVRMEPFIPYIVAKQNESYVDSGRFVQVVPTHTALPKDGELTTPDRLDLAPTDQIQATRGFLPAQVPDIWASCLQVHTYSDGDARGFTIWMLLQIGNDEHSYGWRYVWTPEGAAPVNEVGWFTRQIED